MDNKLYHSAAVTIQDCSKLAKSINTKAMGGLVREVLRKTAMRAMHGAMIIVVNMVMHQYVDSACAH